MASPNMRSVLKQAAMWAALVALTYVFWKWLAGYVLPFAIALVLATILDPAVRFVERRGVSGPVAVAVTLIAGVAGTVALAVALLSLVAKELGHFMGMLPRYTSHWQQTADRWMQRAGKLRTTFGLSPALVNTELNSAMRILEEVLRQLIVGLSSVPSGILVIVVAGVALFFLLRDGRKLERGVEEGCPEAVRPHLKALQREIVRGTLGFLKAQLTLVALTAVTTMVGLGLMGNHYAVILGLIAGVLDLIPFLGPAALLIPWAVVLLAIGDMLGAVKLFAVLLGVGLTRQLVEPKLVGDQTGIHPLWILFAFYVGVQLFGPFGFLIGPISAVMVRATGRMLIAMDWVG